MSRPRFPFKLFPALATVFGITLFVSLGLWQSGKGDRLEAQLALKAERNQLGAVRIGEEAVSAADLQDTPVEVTGHYLAERQVFIDNRQHQGVPGVHVVTPLQIEGSRTHILVNRGWAGWPQGRGTLPRAEVPQGLVTVRGMAHVPSTKPFFLMPDHPETNSQLKNRIDLLHLAEQLKLQPLQPVVVLQDAVNAQDGLIRVWEPPPDKVAMHRGYAFQWFGMAVALLLFFLVFGIDRKGKA